MTTVVVPKIAGAVAYDPTAIAITGGTSQWNDGAAATPSIAWAAEPTNGFYRPSAATTAWVGGTGAIYFTTNNTFGGISGRNNAGSTTSWSIADAGDVTFQTSGAKNLLVKSPQIVAFGSAALATTATAGYVAITSSAGAPTGVPASIPTGQMPLSYDSTNNQIYVYNGAWKKTVALT